MVLESSHWQRVRSKKEVKEICHPKMPLFVMYSCIIGGKAIRKKVHCEVPKLIKVSTMVRGKKKHVTLIVGLKTFGKSLKRRNTVLYMLLCMTLHSEYRMAGTFCGTKFS